MYEINVEQESFLEWVDRQLAMDDNTQYSMHQSDECGGSCVYCQNDRRYEAAQKGVVNHDYQI